MKLAITGVTGMMGAHLIRKLYEKDAKEGEASAVPDQIDVRVRRDDSGLFLSQYVDQGIFDEDPFVHVDQSGVGALIQLATEKARATNKKLHIGVCGEHGGDPKSIEFFSHLGLDYVSCSPFRVPTALLAAAQSAIIK